MRQAQIEVPPHWVIGSDYTSPGGYEAAATLLAKDPPTAIFAGNDMIGIGVLRAAAERNIPVPQQLSVIGFDDIQMSRFVYPALTTVGQSILQLGETAAQLLLRRITGPFDGEAQQVVITPDIVVRESTAPPPRLFNESR
jgi:LacI family transcriptional regulator